MKTANDRDQPEMWGVLCTPDLVPKIWPAERILLGLRVNLELRQALLSCSREGHHRIACWLCVKQHLTHVLETVCYSARETCSSEELARAEFVDLFREKALMQAIIKLRNLRGDAVRSL